MSAPPARLIEPPVIGHRGAAGHAPENTLASLRAAAALGVRWVEFDAKLTGDGQVVLFHDETLERTTDGSGPVADMALEDLRALDAGGWFGEPFRGERIPTLSETLAVLGELKLGANVEIKPDPGREEATGDTVARILAREWPRDLPPPIVSSFKAEIPARGKDGGSGLPPRPHRGRRAGRLAAAPGILGVRGVALCRDENDAGPRERDPRRRLRPALLYRQRCRDRSNAVPLGRGSGLFRLSGPNIPVSTPARYCGYR